MKINVKWTISKKSILLNRYIHYFQMYAREETLNDFVCSGFLVSTVTFSFSSKTRTEQWAKNCLFILSRHFSHFYFAMPTFAILKKTKMWTISGYQTDFALCTDLGFWKKWKCEQWQENLYIYEPLRVSISGPWRFKGHLFELDNIQFTLTFIYRLKGLR